MKKMGAGELYCRVRYEAARLKNKNKLNAAEVYWSLQQKQINREGLDYYVIRRKEMVGLFSFYISAVANIGFAVENGMTPIVDLKNYPNVCMGLECMGEYNPWEKMFIQPCGKTLIDVEKTAKTLHYCDHEVPKIRPTDDTSFLYSLNDKENIWRRTVREYVKPDPAVLDGALRLYDDFSDGGARRVLGVLCRGTDYLRLQPREHPVQPTLEELFEKVDTVKTEYNCEKVFLATEDPSFEKAFRERYGASLCTLQEKKVKYLGGYLSDSIRLQPQNERMELSINYLTKILILSMCRCFVAGRTSGTVGVMLQDHDFEYTYFFDKGRYS